MNEILSAICIVVLAVGLGLCWRALLAARIEARNEYEPQIINGLHEIARLRRLLSKAGRAVGRLASLADSAESYWEASIIRKEIQDALDSDDARRLAADLRRTDDVPPGTYQELANALSKAPRDERILICRERDGPCPTPPNCRAYGCGLK